jgi:D-Tyr-tRNAtyr deacylase
VVGSIYRNESSIQVIRNVSSIFYYIYLLLCITTFDAQQEANKMPKSVAEFQVFKTIQFIFEQNILSSTARGVCMQTFSTFVIQQMEDRSYFLFVSFSTVDSTVNLV